MWLSVLRSGTTSHVDHIVSGSAVSIIDDHFGNIRVHGLFQRLMHCFSYKGGFADRFTKNILVSFPIELSMVPQWMLFDNAWSLSHILRRPVLLIWRADRVHTTSLVSEIRLECNDWHSSDMIGTYSFCQWLSTDDGCESSQDLMWLMVFRGGCIEIFVVMIVIDSISNRSSFFRSESLFRGKISLSKWVNCVSW